MNNTFLFHQGWRFRLAEAFPMAEAMEKCRDREGRLPTDPACDDREWEQVTLPHTFNGSDLFSVPIEDGGSGQKRTCAFYRNRLEIPAGQEGKRVILAFEGVRQTCYVYVNGCLAGYYEAGVGPFGIDCTPYLRPGGAQAIAVATDNTSTRNIPFCIAETPNGEGAVPGSFLQSQDRAVPPEKEGVGFQWNCNDFNPVLGGLARPVRVIFKDRVHLTLPLYANLRSRGTYLWADEFDLEKGRARIHAEAEVRNLTEEAVKCRAQVRILAPDGRELACFASEETMVPPAGGIGNPLSVVPEDAYCRGKDGRWIPREEDACAPVRTDSPGAVRIRFSARVSGLEFWEPAHPALVRAEVTLTAAGKIRDREEIITGFRQTDYDPDRGVLINGRPVWLRGYAQRATNEWAESGIVPQWMHDRDAGWIRESNANHIRWMHVAAGAEDLRACDRMGIVCTQPAGDKEKETFGRQWRQRTELMRNILIAYRNHPSILFWEAGNNAISAGHMREMRRLKEELDPRGGRRMGCRTINTEDVLAESEYTGTMLNRHAARFLAEHGPITETEYSREEAPRRVWDDYSPPDYDYRNRYLGKGGRKQKGLDFYDLTSEDLALANARGYSEFFFDRIGGASGKNLYSACAALCWTDSAQHGRQSWSENGRMSGRVDPLRVKKQSFDVFRVMHSVRPAVRLLGHWNYPPEGPGRYRAFEKRFNGSWWEDTDRVILRDPKKKTVYAAGSYPVAAVVLRVNGREAGRCEKPESGFIFAFPGVDVTESGAVEAIGLDPAGREICRDRIETAGAPAALRLTLHTAPEGWQADGQDLCYADLEVTDAQGRICPLADLRIDFQLEGPAVWLGGYNSGRFNGNGREDSVIGRPFVYAECGTNRVLMRAKRTPGRVRLTAKAGDLPPAAAETETRPCDLRPLSPEKTELREAPRFPEEEDWAAPLDWADRVKYTPEAENYCKILVNGQEPDFRGVRAVNRNGSIWGNVTCVLERMHQIAPDRAEYRWDAETGTLTLLSGGHRTVARIGETHLLTDGQENLMDGQPYVTEEGIPVMEVNAVAAAVQGASVQYDERIGALRITL